MKGLRRVIFNLLNVLSLVLCMATVGLWVRSPAVFDRLSWTDGSGRLWELTSIWGDAALVRVERCGAVVPIRWESFSLDEVGSSNTFRPIADCYIYRTAWHLAPILDRWGRGFSYQSGSCLSAPYADSQDLKPKLEFYDVPFRRWTLPLWALVGFALALPVVRLAARVQRLRRMAVLLPGRHWVKRVLGVGPSIVLLATVLLWWRSYWAMERVIWPSPTSTRYISACRGLIVMEWGARMTRFFDLQMEAAVRGATRPTTGEYSDVLHSPSWCNTYRRNPHRVGAFVIEHFTFEPSRWDLSRADVPITFDLYLDIRHVNRAGFRFDAKDGTIAILPYWVVALGAAIIPALQFAGVVRRRRRVEANQCVQCGYDLRATPERCPECGAIAKGAQGAVIRLS